MAENTMSSDAYKRLKEEFVSDHNGTTVTEIGVVVTAAPLSVLLRFLIYAWLFNGWSKIPAWLRFTTDFCTLNIPLLFCFTVLGNAVEESIATLALVASGLILVLHMAKERDKGKNQKGSEKCSLAEIPMDGRRPFISYFRAYVLIATAISVLAVDFNIFPRKFCKAETYGTGLMDVGVGSFVVSNGIISPEARGKNISEKHSGILGKISGHLKGLWDTIFACIPLIVLGVARILTVKSVDYQEHVTEYGVHWNFFFTLAVVRILASLTYCFLPSSLSWLQAVIVGIGYQYFLEVPDMKNVILNGFDGAGSRNGFLDANREGIFSCAGYLAIFFASVQLGKYLLRPREKLKDWFTCLLFLLFIDAVFWIILQYVEIHVEPVSRRLANLPYVLWMMVYNLQILSLFILAEIIQVLLIEKRWISSIQEKEKQGKPSSKFCLLEAINRNGLFYFLVCNLLTGIVNMSFRTLLMSSTESLFILAGYLFVLSLVVSILHVKNLTLRL